MAYDPRTDYDARHPRPTDVCYVCGVTRSEQRRNRLECTKHNDFGLNRTRKIHVWERDLVAETRRATPSESTEGHE